MGAFCSGEDSDNDDSAFAKPVNRFTTIEEDEPQLYFFYCKEGFKKKRRNLLLKNL